MPHQKKHSNHSNHMVFTFVQEYLRNEYQARKMRVGTKKPNAGRLEEWPDSGL